MTKSSKVEPSNPKDKTVVLCIIDGFAFGKQNDSGNAVFLAETPNLHAIASQYPHWFLQTSGESVGLPTGQMGSSEVGHAAIGSGRVIKNALLKINQSTADEDSVSKLSTNSAIKNAADSRNIHVVGLFSSGGVHSHKSHIFATIKALIMAKIRAESKSNQRQIKILLHIITDGRDTDVHDFALNIDADIASLRVIEDEYSKIYNAACGGNMKQSVSISIATICGRYYAMDRNKNEDRTKQFINLISVNSATNAITAETASKSATAESARTINMETIKKDDIKNHILNLYQNNKTDEFITPISIDEYAGIQNGDSIVFTNFRSDRMRQNILQLAKTTEQLGIKVKITTMTDYFSGGKYKETTTENTANTPNVTNAVDDMIDDIIFQNENIQNTLSEVISAHNLTQLRISETEKYAHVTFFFNGGKEQQTKGETRIMVPSPNVKTYDEKPEMSINKLCANVIDAIQSEKFNLIVLNIANCDMVGHTGNIKAAIKAVQAVDETIGKIQQAVEGLFSFKKGDATLFITADHGNIESMTENNKINTKHTVCPVPFFAINSKLKGSFNAQSVYSNHSNNASQANNVNANSGGGAFVTQEANGSEDNLSLANIAPTILHTFGIAKPKEMTAKSLI